MASPLDPTGGLKAPPRPPAGVISPHQRFLDPPLGSMPVTRIVSGTLEETGRGDESDTRPLRHNEPSLHTSAIMFSDERSTMDNTVREQALHSQVRGVKC